MCFGPEIKIGSRCSGSSSGSGSGLRLSTLSGLNRAELLVEVFAGAFFFPIVVSKPDNEAQSVEAEGYDVVVDLSNI